MASLLSLIFQIITPSSPNEREFQISHFNSTEFIRGVLKPEHDQTLQAVLDDERTNYFLASHSKYEILLTDFGPPAMLPDNDSIMIAITRLSCSLNVIEGVLIDPPMLADSTGGLVTISGQIPAICNPGSEKVFLYGKDGTIIRLPLIGLSDSMIQFNVPQINSGLYDIGLTYFVGY